MYFKSLLASGMHEAKNNRVVLNWTEPCELAFKYIVQYLYTGNYSTKLEHGKHTLESLLPRIPGPDSYPGYYSKFNADADHVHVYVLADRLMMSELKSLALANYKTSMAIPNLSVHACHIESLVELLYYDAIDAKESSEDEEKDEDINPNKLKRRAEDFQETMPLTKTLALDNGKEVTAGAVDNEDPRQDMQRAFTQKVYAVLRIQEVGTVCDKLVEEGGPFARDMFRLTRKA